MSAIPTKLRELGASLMESVRAIIWGQFFKTSLQVQISTLEALCSVFQRISMMENDILNMQQKMKDNHLALLQKLENQQGISTRPELSSKDDPQMSGVEDDILNMQRQLNDNSLILQKKLEGIKQETSALSKFSNHDDR